MIEVIFEMLEEYIDGEINYIKSEIGCGRYDKEDIKDLSWLENMTKEEKTKIATSVANDNELEEIIKELIHYYLYH